LRANVPAGLRQTDIASTQQRRLASQTRLGFCGAGSSCANVGTSDSMTESSERKSALEPGRRCVRTAEPRSTAGTSQPAPTEARKRWERVMAAVRGYRP